MPTQAERTTCAERLLAVFADKGWHSSVDLVRAVGWQFGQRRLDLEAKGYRFDHLTPFNRDHDRRVAEGIPLSKYWYWRLVAGPMTMPAMSEAQSPARARQPQPLLFSPHAHGWE